MVGAITYSVVPLHSATENLQIKHKMKTLLLDSLYKGPSRLPLCKINGKCFSTLFMFHFGFGLGHEGKICRANKRASRKQKMAGQCALYGAPLTALIWVPG